MKVTIIGAGPAGLFCANELVDHCEVEIIEKGPPLNRRRCLANCRLCPGLAQLGVCDVLHGEGGAGGYSDGKIGFSSNRGVQLDSTLLNEESYNRRATRLQQTLAELNPERRIISETLRPAWLGKSEFRFDSYPLWHYGTEGIRKTIRALTARLTGLGVKFRYDTGEWTPTRVAAMARPVILATGSYSTAWTESLARTLGVRLQDGSAGIGIRLETDEQFLKPMMESFYDFKLHLDHKGVDYRSFCVNGSGVVLNGSHLLFPKRPVTTINGRAEDGNTSGRANLAILAKLTGTGAKYLVRYLAESVNAQGNGRPLIQRATDFLRPVNSPPEKPLVPISTNPATFYGRLQDIWPEWIVDGFQTYLWNLERLLQNSVLSDSSTVYAPEIKYHGLTWPLTNGFGVKEVSGLYIIGNATGYIDSFASAAITGMACGEFLRAN